MKQNLLFSISGLIIGIVLGGGIVFMLNTSAIKERERAKSVINQSRASIIELNKKYNEVYNNLGILSYELNNNYAKSTMQLLQQFTQPLIDVNKSLGLDCKKYQDGSPIMMQDINGKKTPVEIIPEEIRIIVK